MVHKKYLWINGKRYGPYYYESYREGNKVKKRYIAAPSPDELKSANNNNWYVSSGVKKVMPFVLLCIALGVLVFFLAANYTPQTARVVLDADESYVSGESIEGVLKFTLRAGELIPSDSRVIISLGEQRVEKTISEIVTNTQIDGKFYADGANIGGEGSGYGLAGSRVNYPAVDFEIIVSEPNGEPSLQQPETPEPEAPAVPETEQPAEETAMPSEIPEETTPETETSEDAGEISSDNSAGEESSTQDDSQETQTDSSGITGAVISESSISGSARKGEDFEYSLGEGESAELVSGSVRVDGEEIGDENVELRVENGEVIVSTDYETLEEGFGEDYLGDNSILLDVDLADLGIKAEEGILSIQLVYGSEEIASAEKEISVEGAAGGAGGTIIENETINETGILINETLLNETLANITEENLTILNETNITLIEENLTGNITITITRARIRLGERVKWTKNVTLETSENVAINLPAEAENITVRAIEQDELVEIDANIVRITGEVSAEIDLSKEPRFIRWLKKIFSRFTGRVVEEVNTTDSIIVELEENATDYTIEYYTEAPQAFEQETPAGKRVVISGPEELNYTDIVSFANIAEKVNVGQEGSIRIRWVEQNVNVGFEAYDLDGNGKLDYVEWITPHLSNQTFEIIFITKAEHLDENRMFLEDVYELVKEQDGNYSEIPAAHYIRATFKQMLTSERDIT
ncbi:MAG: hypothetical protein MUF61_02525, partial [archaeon]|nr:hypothetical protein [archaeon]